MISGNASTRLGQLLFKNLYGQIHTEEDSDFNLKSGFKEKRSQNPFSFF